MKHPINPAIGRKLRNLREDRGYTQQTLADRMNTAPSWISRCESGANLTVQTLERFAKELRVDITELL
jgi:transcriptional regulator with XRE-family HTH domain